MYNNIANYYSTLFNVNIAIFGISLAVFFVFYQIACSVYSFKQVKYIISRNWYFVFYFFLSILSLGTNALCFFFSSIQYHNIFPKYNFNTSYIISNQYFMVFAIFLLCVSAVPLIIYISNNIEFLQPSKMVLLFIKDTNNKSITNYLFKKYGVDSPTNPIHSFKVELYIEDIKEAEITQQDIKKEETKQRLNLKLYNKLQKSSQYANNPFEPMNDLIMSAIDKVELNTLDSIITTVSNVSKNYIYSIPITKFSYDWNPHNKLAAHYIDLFIESIDSQMKVCESKHIDILNIKILAITKSLADLLIEYEQFNILSKILDYWKKIGDHSINDSHDVFNAILDYYLEIGEVLLNKYPKDENLNSVFSNVGWLGERLLSKKSIEIKPLMHDSGYQNEFDRLMEFIYTFKERYVHNHPDLYPLVYFATVIVTIKKLMYIYKEHPDNFQLKSSFSSLFYIYYDFCEKAIIARNSQGSALAAMRLKEVHDTFRENGVSELADDCAVLLLQIGALAEEYKSELGKVEFLGSKPLNEWVVENIIEIGYYDKMDNEVRELLIKASPEHSRDAVWNYIKRLGKIFGNNFGLSFDPQTGDYLKSN